MASCTAMRVGSVIAIVGLVLGAVVCAAPAATAQESEADVEARAHFQTGTGLFQVGDYEGALREYELAYELSGRAELLYNVFMCHERMGRLEDAASVLRRFLAEQPDVEGRAALEARLETLERRIEEARRGGEPEPVSEAEQARTDEPARTEDTRPEPPRVAVSAAAHGGGLSTPAAVSLGVTLALTALWGAAAIAVLVIDQELERECTTSVIPMCSHPDTDAQRSVGAVADSLLGLAAAGGILTLVLALTTSDAPQPSREVSLRPWADTASVGLSLAGRL